MPPFPTRLKMNQNLFPFAVACPTPLPGRPAGTSSIAPARLPRRHVLDCPYSPSVRNTLNIGEILFLSDRKKYGIINSLK